MIEKYDETTGQYYYKEKDVFNYYLTEEYQKQHDENIQMLDEICFVLYGTKI